MGRYAHPALAEREEIMLMRHEGRSPADIARATGRDRSTISREMRRNSFRVGAGPLLPGIDRATLLRGAQALLRASQDPRRRGARRARHAADRAGALVARADRRQDRGRTSGPVGVRVDHLPGRQRRQARLARAGARQTGHQGAPTPQGQAAAPEGRAESRMARRRPARSSTSRCRTIPGSAAPTRTPTAWSASTSPRAPTSTRPATNGFVRCMMRSATGRASAMASGRPTRSTIRRRCTCSENSSPIKPKKSLED